MATATMLDQQNWSAAGMHTITMKSNQPCISGASTFALLPISCCVAGPHALGLPFSREDPPGSAK